MGADKQPLLTIQGLLKRFRRHGEPLGPGSAALAAVNGLDLELGRGEIFGLAGESGSGKSTLARMLCQLIEPDEGVISLDGVALARMNRVQRKEARRRIQMVFQDPSTALSPKRRVRQTLLEPQDHFALGERAQREQRAIDALADVGLEPSAMDRLPHQFSSGQRQRICIARALLARPDLLVADEVVSALDTPVQARVLQLLADLRARRGLTILLISHDLAVVRQLSDRVGVMYAGRLVEQGPVEAVLDRPAHPYTQQLLAAATDPAPRSTRREVAVPPTLGMGALPNETGCAFADRCAQALPACRQRPPTDRPVHASAGHVVKCWLAAEETHLSSGGA